MIKYFISKVIGGYTYFLVLEKNKHYGYLWKFTCTEECKSTDLNYVKQVEKNYLEETE